MMLLYVSTAHSPRLRNGFSCSTFTVLDESTNAPGNENGGAFGFPRTTPSRPGAVSCTALSAQAVESVPIIEIINKGRVRTEVLVCVRARVKEKALATGLFDLERGDERVRDVAHVDELRRVVVHFVVFARGRELLEDDLGGQIEVLDGLPLQIQCVSDVLHTKGAKTYVVDDRLQSSNTCLVQYSRNACRYTHSENL